MNATMAVLAALKAIHGWKFYRGEDNDEDDTGDSDRALQLQEDGHKGFFVVRRVRALAAMNPDWLDESDFASLKTRIGEEFLELEAYIQSFFTGEQSLLTTNPDGAASGSASEAFSAAPDAHINLQDVATWQVDGEPVRSTVQNFRRQRVEAARAILWRAPGVHPELWNNAAAAEDRLRKPVRRWAVHPEQVVAE